MASRIQIRRDTAANWSANNPTLASGEIAFVTDENKIKVGDGGTAWNSLAYLEADAYLDSVVMGDDTTGDYVETLIASDGISISGEGQESASVTITNTGVLSLAGTTNEVEVSASSGNITLSLPTSITVDVVGDVTGNADTASTLATPRNISLGGDVSGSASFDGSADITITATVADDSHDHTIANVDGLQTALDNNASSASAVASDLTDHENATTNVHGIANTSELATKTYADNAASSAVANLVDSAPSTLDTLNELAAALDDDPNFATTVTNSIATKADDADLTSHENATTNVHGITDTSLLATTSYVDTAESDAVTTANAYSDSLATNYDSAGSAATAESNANSYTDTEVSTHNSDTTNVHGIADTSALATKTYADNAGVTSLAGTLSEINVSASSGAVTLSLPATINADTTGNAATASTLETARSISLSGDVSGSASFDGGSNVTITATVADDSHNHTISNVDGLQNALDAKLPSTSYTASDVLAKIKTVDGASSELDADLLDGQHGSHYLDWTNTTNKPDPTITLTGDVSGSATLTDLNSASVTVSIEPNSVELGTDTSGIYVARISTSGDGLSATGSGESASVTLTNTGVTSLSGTASEVEVSASTGSVTLSLPSTINANTTGNAATSTKLATERAISLSGDVSGSANFDGSASISITATVADDSHNHTISNVDGLQSALDAKAPLASPTLTGTPAAPTATAGNNSTQIATTAFVQTAVGNLIDGAPGALDTLNELAASLGDDSDFAGTVTNSLAGKQPLDADLTAIAGLAGTSGFLKKTAANTWSLDTNTYLTGNQTITLTGDATGSGTTSITVTVADDSHNHIISNVDGLQSALDAKLDSTSYTASDVLTKIKTVDGASSGLDADLLDGENGSYYLDWTNTTNKPDPTITLGGDASGSVTLTNLGNGTLTVTVADDSHNHIISNVDGLQTALDAKLDSTSYTAADVLTKIKTVDGAGSGLDADLLDGQSSAYYRNVGNFNAGTLAIARGGTNTTATPTDGGIAYGTGSAIAYTSVGTSGQVLVSNGTSAPTWGSVEAGFNPFLLAGL